MSKYAVGDIIETKYFYSGSHGKNIYKRGTILKVIEDECYVIGFEGQTLSYQERRITMSICDKLSKKFDPGSGPARKFKFLSL